MWQSFVWRSGSLVVPVVSLLLAALSSGCGARVGGLCEESVDCGYIDEDDEQECRSDLRRALDAGDLDKHHVDNCLGCMRDNDCGADFFIDCADSCSKVQPYVFGSRIH